MTGMFLGIRNISNFSFVILIFLANQNIFAQSVVERDYSFRHLTVEDGLTQSTVTCIIQDKKGYIWLGTEDGLNRYDGNNFKHFKHDPLDTLSILPSEIKCIAESNTGLLLIGTDGGGINIFDQATSHVSVYKHNAIDSKSISNNRVYAICAYNDSMYWIGTFGGGLDLFNFNTKHFQHFLPDKKDISSFSNFIVSIVSDKNHNVYLGTRNGLFLFNPQTQQFKSFINEKNCINCISSNAIQSLYDDEDNLWIGTYEGILNSFNKSTEKFTQYENNGNNISAINSIIRVSQELLWLGTREHGISVFNEKEKVFKKIVNDPFNPGSINNNSIDFLFQTKDKIFLIGTIGGGLNLYHKSYNFINTDQKFLKNTLAYSQNNFCILEDTVDIIWSGSLGDGLRAYDTRHNKVEFYKNNIQDKNSISSNSIFCLYRDDKSDLWIGTIGGGLNRFDYTKKTFINYQHDSAKNFSINSNNVLCITQSHDRQLWLGTQRGGINVFNIGTSKFFHFVKDTSEHASVNSNTIFCLKEDRYGNMLIGTQGGGLNILNRSNGKIEYYLNKKNDKNSISNNNVKCIYEDEHGLLWLATEGGGLNVFDRVKNIFHCFTERDGLPNNSLYGILADNEGALWMSTNKGICKFSYSSNLDVEELNDPTYISKNISIQNYDHNDGLISDEFNLGAYFKSQKGTMYFGGVKGIISFNPEEIKKNTFSPPTVITRIKNYKEEIPFNDSSEIVLDYKNYLTIDFASLSYLAPEKNNYAFMFEGRDTAWNDLGTTRNVNFLDLKPGDYVLKIRSSNNDGVWGKEPAVVKIKVNPPFYETWWFRISVAVAVAVAVVTTFRVRVSRIRKDEAQKTAFNKSLAEMEMKALRAQMNPHFVFNCLNSIHNYILKNDKLNASDYLTKFSRLIRLILENSRHKTVPLKKDLEALELYIKMEQLRLTEPCEVKIEIENDFEIQDALIPPLILQPFVENSFKHGLPLKGKEGVLTINIKAENESLICIVEDNGVGRKSNDNEQKTDRKSLGMTITKERLSAISQTEQANAFYEIIDLKDSDDKPCGTRVIVKVPLTYN